MNRTHSSTMCFIVITFSIFSSCLLANTEEKLRLAIVADKALGLNKSPLVSLLEVELSKRQNLELLERVEIEKILQEQQLELMFKAQGTKDRISAGKLLKADLLVLLRAKEKSGIRSLDIILADVQSGLRLLVWTIPWSDDILKDVEILQGLVNQALEKYKEGINQIVAIPPFESNDLTHEHDYLQIAYARIVEKMLLNQKGIVVVELEEAHAIAQELSLSGGSFGVYEKAPLFILGEYRHAGIKENRTIAINISLQQDGVLLGGKKQSGMTQHASVVYINQAISELIEKHLKKQLVDASSTLVTKQLNQKAHAFLKIGNWKEALNLLEASLLIEPNQSGVRELAIKCITKMTQKTQAKKPRIAIDYYKRGINHFEQWLYSDDVSFFKGFVFPFWRISYDISHNSWYEKEGYQDVRGSIVLIEKEKIEAMIRYLKRAIQEGPLKHDVRYAIEQYIIIHPRGIYNTIEEEFALKLRVISIIKDDPQVSSIIRQIEDSGLGYSGTRSPAYRSFLDQLADIPSEKVQNTAKILTRQFEKRLSRHQNRTSDHSPPAPESEKSDNTESIAFSKLTLDYLDKKGIQSGGNKAITGWIRCEEGIDVVSGWHSLWVMKKRGQLNCIYSEGVMNLTYDGKYVWGYNYKNNRVVVLDPDIEKIWEFTPSDGLPTGITVFATISPGKVCAASRSDYGVSPRCWLAFLEIGNKGNKKVDIFHEARMLSGTNKNSIFNASDMWKLYDPNDRAKDVLILMAEPPRVINIKDKTVDIIADYRNPPPKNRLDESISLSRWQSHYFRYGSKITFHNGSVWWITDMGTDRGKCLWRIGHDLQKRMVSQGLFEAQTGPIYFHKNSIYILGRNRLWVAENSGELFVPMSLNIMSQRDPDFGRFIESNHYGLLLLMRGTPDVYEINL